MSATLLTSWNQQTQKYSSYVCMCLYPLLNSFKKQGIGGPVREPAHITDTDYRVEKTYHLAPYLGPYIKLVVLHLSDLAKLISIL